MPFRQQARSFATVIGGAGRTDAPEAIRDVTQYKPPAIDFTMPAYPLKQDDLKIDKRAYGVPFIIDDQRALDDAMRYHKCAVKVESVERLMLPFWFATTQSGGTFSAEIFMDDPTQIRQTHPTFCTPRPFNFAYPFGEHNDFNQISASYSAVANSWAEKCLAGTHVPGHLISRFELLEELERQEVTPKLLPFEMSVSTLLQEVSKRATRERVEFHAKKEMRKFYTGIKSVTVRFIVLVHEVLSVRPVFLPVYKMMVTTVSNRAEPIPLYISGVNGRAAGPVVHTTPRKLFVLGAISGATAAAAASTMTQPPIAAAFGAISSLTAVMAKNYQSHSAAMAHADEAREESVTRSTMNADTDKEGYKWKVEDEERYEYEHREELRSRARRRKAFEQRLREEAEREEAQRTGRAYTPSGGRAAKSKISPSKHDRDPLQYYVILGLKGLEDTATKSDVSKGFRRQAQKHHPDVTPLDKQDQAKEMMQKIVEAYNILRDPKLRKEYDAGLLTK